MDQEPELEQDGIVFIVLDNKYSIYCVTWLLLVKLFFFTEQE